MSCKVVSLLWVYIAYLSLIYFVYPIMENSRKCICNWVDCADLQLALLKYCCTTGENDVALGTYRVTNQPGTQRLRQSVMHHLKFSKEEIDSRISFSVAKHHFPLPLLVHNGTKKFKVDSLLGEDTILPEIQGESGKVKMFKTALPASVASKCGIHERVDWWSVDSGGQLFVQAPLAPRQSVQERINSFTSSRGIRQLSRVHVHKPLESLLPSTPSGVADIMPDAVCDTEVAATTESSIQHPSPSAGIVASSVEWTSLSQLVMTQPQLHHVLQRRYLDLGMDGNAFCACTVVQQAFRILRDIHFDTSIIELDSTSNIYARHCYIKGDNCQLFEIVRKQCRHDIGACSPCQAERVKRQRLEMSNSTTSPTNACRRFQQMDKQELIDLLRERTRKLRYSNWRLQRAQARLHKERSTITVSKDDSDLLNLVRSASSFVTDNKQDATLKILDALVKGNVDTIGLKQGSAKSSASIKEECAQFAHSIVEEIVNFSKRVNEKPSQVQFSPRVMRMALSLYLEGQQAYKTFANTSIQALPSISRLKKLKAVLTPEEGTFPRCYGWFKDEFLSSSNQRTDSDYYGHIMLDEMKLKSDFYWNPSNNKCVGIVVDNTFNKRLDLCGEVSSLYRSTPSDSNSENDAQSEEASDDSYSVSLSVNQFRFRSANNTTHVGEFFYNNGSLTGDELLLQVKQVVLGYEMIDVKILGIACDGGGNNARLFKMLRLGDEPQEGVSWLTEEQVSFQNPYDPSQRIALFHCSTHNLKNMRNALYNSDESRGKATRDFTLKGVRFGWRTVVDTYKRDNYKDSVPDTSLRNGSVYPDKWSKMDVKLAKDPFKYDTLSFQVLHIAEVLCCVDQVVCVKRENRHEKDMDIILAQVECLKEMMSKQEKQDGVVASDLATLEYCANVGSIYLDHFMNRNKKITRENIDEIEARMKERFEFFRKWREDQLEQQDKLKTTDSRSKAWQQWFISHATYLHMRIGVVGFLQYARYLLKCDSKTKYVPFLHSNTSILEALFSQVRRMNRDSPLKYGSALLADSKFAADTLDNGMYSNVDVEPSVSPMKSLEKFTSRKDCARDAAVEEMVKEQRATCDSIVTNENPGGPFLLMRESEMPHSTTVGKKTVQRLRTMYNVLDLRSDCSYADYLFQNEDFLAYASVCMDNEKLLPCFQTLACLSVKGKRKFHKSCQVVFELLLHSIDGINSDMQKSVNRSFMVHILKLQVDAERMDLIKASLPRRMKNLSGIDVFMRFIIDAIAKLFLSRFHGAIDELQCNTAGERQPPVSEANTLSADDCKKEVQFFVGFAVSKCIAQVADDSESVDEENFIASLSIDHDAALLDIEYLQKYYPRLVELKNQRSRLRLVSSEYFLFGLDLMARIRDLFNQDSIKKLGTSCFESSWKELSNDATLWNQFQECSNPNREKVDGTFVREVYAKILKTTFNARAGAESDRFKEENTSRYCAQAVDTALREGLKTLAKRTRKELAVGRKKERTEED